MNTLGDALKKALKSKENDYSNFIWKGAKKKVNGEYVQESIRLVDMSEKELKNAYNHCERMLHSENVKHLGRYNVLDEVLDQIKKCNIELFLRYCENSYLRNERNPISRQNLYYALRKFIENTNKKRLEVGSTEIEDWSKIPITDATTNLPEEFANLSIAEVLDGCIEYLGAFDKEHITMTFITKMGIWFTKAEENEFKVPSNSNYDRLPIAKERLKLPEKWPLKLSDKGLTYHEMRAMLTLPKQQRYNDMTTEQLSTLRDKVLLRYMKQVDGHIFSWKRLERQILLVAKEKGFNLDELE